MDAVYLKCANEAIYNELLLGLQPFVYWHVTESVQEGYTPDAIGELQEELEVEALVLERGSDARDRALGYFFSLLRHYLDRQSDVNDVDAAIHALNADLDKETPTAPFADFHLDIADIYAYIEEEKQNAGLIADDPEWHQQPNVANKLQWNAVFQRSLDATRLAYVQACERFEHRFKLGSQADIDLLQLIGHDQLANLASEFRAKPRHIPAPPSASAGPAGYWQKRIGNECSESSKHLPTFDQSHLVQAGQQFRSACIDAVRAREPSIARTSEPGKDVDVILSQALNLDTNPEKLVERAQQQLNSCTAASSPKAAAVDEEAIIRRAKDLLTSALRSLIPRDGQRNVSLQIASLNLRGHINNRLASLKSQHEANYLSRAVADWSASVELDADQGDIVKVLAQTETRLESLSKDVASTENQEILYVDSLDSRRISKSGNSTQPTLTDSTKPQPAACSPEQSRNGKSSASSTSAAKVSSDVQKTESGSAGKAREKTILESPFFRSDLVTGLMVDSLLALAFPHRAFRETHRLPSAAALAAASQDHVPMLERLAKSHQQSTKALTVENKDQLRAAVKAVSAVLALPDVQQLTKNESPKQVLRKTSLRLVLGTLFLLQGNLVKAQTELELVSNALRPNSRKPGLPLRKNSGKQSSDVIAENQETLTERVDDEEATREMQTRVQGQTLFLLAKACWLANKVQEAIKFFRWFVKWYSDQQAERVVDAQDDAALVGASAVAELHELDMTWWDKVVVVTKT